MNSTETIALSMGDALIVNDVQNDFLPGGRLGVPDGDKVIPVLNAYIDRFVRRQLTVIATRDWHPPNHGSFLQQGGPWPEHCIAGTNGADFADGLRLPTTVHVIGKGMEAENEGYSAFSNPDFGILLDRLGITRLFVGGLTTDYCVFNTICDALKYGYQAVLLADAVRAVNVHARDGERAIDAMIRQGAIPVTLDRIQ
ncbi:MAG: isochorismatase family protein [Gammaproteobacteria bacterium]